MTSPRCTDPPPTRPERPRRGRSLCAPVLDARRRRTGQAGFTLLELVMSMGIAAILIVPVGSWMLLVMQTQGPTATRFSDSSQARLANTFLSRDVASAELVRTTSFGVNPSCGTDATDNVLLQLVDVGSEPVRTVYVSHVDGGVMSVWRRTCKVSDTSVVLRQTKVLRGVATTPAPAAVCTPPGETNCRQVTFTATLESGKLINVRAMRRATLDPEHVGTGGNSIPFAVITEVSRSGQRPTFTVVLSSARSADVDGSIVSRTWGSATGPVTVAADDPSGTQATYTFSEPGRYTVKLAVSDGIDTATTSTTIDVLNQSPVLTVGVDRPQGSVDSVGSPGSGDPFQFNAAATDDGDSPFVWNWNFGDGAVVDSGDGTATPVVHFTDVAQLGVREVTLSVTDSLGATAVDRVTIELVNPGGGDPGAGSISIVTDAPPGVLVNVPGKTPRAGTVGPGLPAVTVTFSTPGGGTLAWQLRRGTDVIESSSAQTFSHVFGAADAGEWTIVLSVDGGPETVTDFRLNAAPVAAFVSPTGGGSAPLPVAFDSRSSSDDGSIVAWSWNFGFFDKWTSTAAGPTQLFPNPGIFAVTLTVTDDDGAQNTKIANVTIGGTPDPPAAGGFDANTYSFSAIPGAEDYEVRLDVTGGGACLQTSYLSVAPSEAPSVSTAYPSCTVAASHRVRAGGKWSGFSSVVTRP